MCVGCVSKGRHCWLERGEETVGGGSGFASLDARVLQRDQETLEGMFVAHSCFGSVTHICNNIVDLGVQFKLPIKSSMLCPIAVDSPMGLKIE